MATIKNDAAYMALPMNIKRGNPIPLDTTAVWYNKTELETYAASGATAYVGQILTLVADSKCEAYMISNEAGTLIKLAATTSSGDLAADVLTLQGQVADLISKVGTAAQGETVTATGLYKEIADVLTVANKGVADAATAQAAAEKAVGDAINRVNSAIEAKQDHLTEQDKQEIVLTGMTTGPIWTDTEQQQALNRLAIIKNALDDGIAIAGAQYYLGERKTVSIVLPDDVGPGDMITVSWYNGETAATLSITGKMLYFDFTPTANTRSEINALWDGTYWAVLGNEIAVPSEVIA